MKPFSRSRKPSVITSYSIHYTKLYELDRPAEARRRYDEAVERTVAVARQRNPLTRLIRDEAEALTGVAVTDVDSGFEACRRLLALGPKAVRNNFV